MSSIKIPTTKYLVHDIIKQRWSARAFSTKELSDDNLNTLFEAASWASSSMNDQPWRFVFCQKNNKEIFDSFISCLLPGNASWAKNAAAIVLVTVKTKFPNGNPNRHAMHDVGAATTNLLLQAASMDIYGHIMGGFDMQKTRELFKLTDDLEIASFVALGYLDNPETLEEPFKTREVTARSRKNLEEIAFKHQFPSKETWENE